VRVAFCTLMLLLLWSCAPLTRPPAPDAPTAESTSSPVTSALQDYLSRRSLDADAQPTRPHIAVLPFVDESGFRQGIWDLENEMARFMATSMVIFRDWQVVPHDAVQEALSERREIASPDAARALGERVMADIVVRGTIREFNMGRFTVGDPLLGGYKSYQGIAGLEVSALRVADGSEIAAVEATRETVNRDLGLDLFGKPREQDVQFTQLSQTAFGSEEFRATVLGEATVEAMEELLARLAAAIRPGALHLSGRIPTIVSADGEVYINIGSENGVRVGYVFAVFPGLDRVRENDMDRMQQIGTVVVDAVIGARLSSVRVVERADLIAAGDRLQLQDQED
jgi:TolB-like protein